MRIFEFLQEDNGSFSSTRLFAFMIVTCTVIEWMHAVFFGTGIYSPDYTVVGLVAGVLGFKVLQKGKEEINQEDNSIG